MNPNTVGPEVGRNDLLRTIGGVLLATFAFVLFIRKGQNHRWGDFALLLVLLVPFLALYGAGTSGPALVGPREAPGQRWHAVFVVLAVILAPLTLFQFLHWVGGNTHDSLNAAWIFGLTAVVAGLAARRAGVSYATLLAGLAIVIAWLELWDKILNPSGTTVRWLLLI